ncbi:MAG: hypothetical protein V1761_02175 [bacterium]
MKTAQRINEVGVTNLALSLDDGSLIELTSVGASLCRWKTADGLDLVAGYQDESAYGKHGMYLGTTVGLNAGRIKDGRCTIDGVEYALTGKAKHFLHGGDDGLDAINFIVASSNGQAGVQTIDFRTNYRHPFIPATIQIDVIYTVSSKHLRIDFVATTNHPVICNLTNHSYFNPNGDYDHPAADLELFLSADRVVLVDDEINATDILKTSGTIFDFQKLSPLLPTVLDSSLQHQGARGLDHYFLFAQPAGPQIILSSKNTGKRLEISTSYPGTTIYTTNYPTRDRIQTGRPLARHAAVAIEPQFQANGINDHRFHDYTLRPGETYRHSIDYVLKEESR